MPRRDPKPPGGPEPVSPGPADAVVRQLIDQLAPPERLTLALCLIRSVRDASELSPRSLSP